MVRRNTTDSNSTSTVFATDLRMWFLVWGSGVRALKPLFLGSVLENKSPPTRFSVQILRWQSVMIKRGKWGNSYWAGRGEILWSTQEALMRRHFTKMLSLIKDEGYGREDD